MESAAKTPPVPDAAAPARPWLAVLSIASSASAFVTAEFLPVGLLRYISGGMHISEGTAGLMVTMPGLLAAIAAPGLTIAIGGRDRRAVLLFLGLMLIGSNLLSMLAPSFSVLLVARVLFGVGLGGFWAIGAGLGARLVPSESVAKATSIIFAGISAGMLVGGAAGALIGEVFGWRAAFGFELMLSLFSFFAQWIYLPPLRDTQQTRLKDLLAIVKGNDSRIGLLTMAIVLTAQFATYTYITEASKRRVPLHPKLIELGLLAYVQGRKAAGAVWLWDLLWSDKDQFGKYPSRNFTNLLQQTGVHADHRKVFHSLRSTVNQRLEKNGMQEGLRRRFLGHDPVTTEAKSYQRDDDGHSFPMRIAFDILSRVNFPVTVPAWSQLPVAKTIQRGPQRRLVPLFTRKI